MPELPEVETVCRGLQASIVKSAAIESVVFTRKNLRAEIPKNMARNLVGTNILNVRRRAKYILFDTPRGVIINHLGMTGSWRWLLRDESLLMHDHCAISFKGGARLVYRDPRRFGLIDWAKPGCELKSRWLKHLGIEPLTEEFHAISLRAKAKGRTAPVKNFIMDQKIVVGIGNIYASEVLFLAGINPGRGVGRVKIQEWEKICKATHQVLNAAIDDGGTTLRDYVSAAGESGAFQLKLNVYGRAKKSCRVCQNSISTKPMAGRATYWCKKCQK